MVNNNDWWTSPAEGENGNIIMVTGRRDVEHFRNNPKFSIRVEVSWKYDANSIGMPDEETAKLMEKVQDALTDTFHKDPIAVLTGIYTGDGERNWVFYTLSTNIFGRKLNEALQPFELLPITIYCENDPGWNEYDEMKDLSEIFADE